MHPRDDEGRVVNHASRLRARSRDSNDDFLDDRQNRASELAGKPAGKRVCRVYVCVCA